MGQLKPLLDSIAKNAEIQKYNWLHLRSLIIITTRDMLINMQNLFPYEKTAQNEGFEDELDIVLQFLCVFEQKPPFTLQRICELLIDPQKHYKSSKKILFAMEKLVNVSIIKLILNFNFFLNQFFIPFLYLRQNYLKKKTNSPLLQALQKKQCLGYLY